LLLKTNQITTERSQFKTYISSLERLNKDLQDKLTVENSALKDEKTALLNQINLLMQKNLAFSKQLEEAEVYLNSNSSILKINSLKADNDLLRKQLSELRQGGDSSFELSAQLLKLQKEGIEKDKEYRLSLQQLHGQLSACEAEKLNSKMRIEAMEKGIRKFNDALFAQKVKHKKLSLFLVKFYEVLEKKHPESGYVFPDKLRDLLETEKLESGESSARSVKKVSFEDKKGMIVETITQSQGGNSQRSQKGGDSQRGVRVDQAVSKKEVVVSKAGSQKGEVRRVSQRGASQERVRISGKSESGHKTTEV
jgi:hypothetical protein